MERPLGITIICILGLIVSIVGIVVSPSFIWAGGRLLSPEGASGVLLRNLIEGTNFNFPTSSTDYVTIGTMIASTGGALLIISIIGLLILLGLWKMKNWARKSYIVICILTMLISYIIISIQKLPTTLAMHSIFGLIIPVIILAHLLYKRDLQFG